MSTIRCGWAILFSVSTYAAIGCGGGDKASSADTESATTETQAPRSNSSGTAGAPSRTSVTPDECIAQTTGIFSLRPDAASYSQDCINCMCTEGSLAVGLCDDQSNLCWGLVNCAAENCSDVEGIDAANCALSKCSDFIGGSGLAMSVGALIQSDACSAKCPHGKK